MSETKEQMAERLTIGATLRTPYEQEALILAALREVEARGEQRAATLGGALLDSAVERAEKAEAENARLREALTAAQVRANEATVLVGLYRRSPAEPKP